MPEIAEFEKMASKLLSDYEVYWKPSTPEMNYSEHAQRTREAIAQALREVHDSAVEKCASYCEAYPFDADLERRCGCIPNTKYAKLMRSLKKSNS